MLGYLDLDSCLIHILRCGLPHYLRHENQSFVEESSDLMFQLMYFSVRYIVLERPSHDIVQGLTSTLADELNRLNHL